ncbi:hypothetical protein [Evansella tamaricis]|uniref:Uncharacterized protein n=1 Tax=Evansella tamaricis TaxID=2069301 RepID=A0ABS6JGB0_9BACI|nr:hypothetical protein [Evansella tamaricis]MBU9712726.1 hypothetical protein [Evansella tamaricis]
MQFSLDFPTNIIELITTSLTWGFLIYGIYYYYQKQNRKPKIWKACVAMLVGLFAFSLDFAILGTIIKIPILPIGVWLLLWYAKGKPGAWDKYRSFAWLGFIGNFIFVVAAIVSVLFHNLIYPKSDLETYISTMEEHAMLVAIHPSAEEVTFDSDSFKQHFSSFKEEPFDSIEWYNDINFNMEPADREEIFPYVLTGTSSKWGSGLPTIIYVERDGKGLIVDSSERQRYFRGEESFLKGGGK